MANAYVSVGDYGRLLEIMLYFVAFIAIIYVLYKLFGLFKDLGGDIEKKLNELKNTLGNLNPSDAPGKFKQTGEDIATIVTGTLTGKQNTGKYNEAMTRLHYGGREWEPGNADVDEEGNIHKYGQVVKPGETKIFHGGYYVETVTNNLVKSPYSSKPIPKEDALAMKYGFNSYANFHAWLEGVKAALKVAGKDPSRMTLDQIVKYGRELEKKKEEWRKQHPEKAIPVFDAQDSTVPAYLKKYALPLEKSDELQKKIRPRTPGGGIEIRYTPIKFIKNYPAPIKPKPHPLPLPAPHKRFFVR